MADSLLFDGVDDYIQFTNGDFVGNTASGLTMIAIVKMSADDTRYRNFVGYNALDAVFGINNTNPAHMIWYPENGPSDSTSNITASDGWVIVGHSRASGTVAGRFHRYIYDTATWTHDNGDETVTALGICTSLKIGASGTPGNYFAGNILIAGAWDTNLSDGTIESLYSGKAAWITADPDEAWRLDSTSSISSFTGVSTETTRVGTTLDAGDAPAGWLDTADTGLAWITA